MKQILIFSLCLHALGFSSFAGDGLSAGFAHPPQEMRPSFTMWFPGGIVTEEGMAADFKAWAEAGVGAVDWMDARYDMKIAPVPGLPPRLEHMGARWYELVRRHGELARENGLTLQPHNHLGNYIGIPQKALDHLPKEVLFSVVEAQGGSEVTLDLPQPVTRPITPWPGVKDYYRDITVYAYPTPEVKRTAVHAAKPALSVNAPYEAKNLAHLLDGEVTTFWGSVQKVDASAPPQITFTFAQPFEAAGLSLVPAYHKGPKDCVLEVSDDGQAFREVAVFSLGVAESRQIRFAPVKARQFRLTVRSVHLVNPPYDTARGWLKLGAAHIAEAELLAPGEEPFARQDIRLLYWKMGRIKGGDHPWGFIEGDWYDPALKARTDVQPSQVVDLTRLMDAQGRLRWEAPAGNWTIVRMGYGLTAGQIAAAGPISATLDLMNKDSAKLCYETFCTPFLKALGDNRKLVTLWHEDSFETDCANWTPGFREQFQKRRGYDLLPWMEVLRGRVVASVEQSERFLWDYRRTIADLVAENHYAAMRDLSHADGIPFAAQGTAGLLCPVDPIQMIGQSDIPAGEFWYRNDLRGTPRRAQGDAIQGNWQIDQLKVASSAARIYGKKNVLAESTTNGWEPWVSPFDLRYAQDFALMDGATMFSYYNAPHQPYAEPKRAGNFEDWGTHWSRNSSVWSLTRPFLDYVARCTWLMRHSTPRCDVLYFYGEDVPNVTFKRETLDPAVPHGWNYDFVNADVLLNHARAENGTIKLDSGLEYRLLIMPKDPRLTPEVARAVARLIEGGVKVVGPRPTTSPSLKDWPRADAEVARVARLWDQGKAIAASALEPVLASIGLAKDFSFECAAPKAHFNFAHQQAGDTHLYMVANAEPLKREFTASFRVTGLVPEIWDADAGTRSGVADYTDDGTRTSLPMKLAENQSLFVVFRPKGHPAAAPVVKTAPAGIAPLDLSKDWVVNFPKDHGARESMRLGQLRDLATVENLGVKYFSGTVTYRKAFNLPEFPVSGLKFQVLLRLGKVHDGAELVVNGRSVRTLWSYPFEADIAPFVKAGENLIEVRVSNTWHNRFIGDSALPREQWVTEPFSNVQPKFRAGLPPFTPFSSKVKLRPAGLIGPVSLEVLKETLQ